MISFQYHRIPGWWCSSNPHCILWKLSPGQGRRLAGLTARGWFCSPEPCPLGKRTNDSVALCRVQSTQHIISVGSSSGSGLAVGFQLRPYPGVRKPAPEGPSASLRGSGGKRALLQAGGREKQRGVCWGLWHTVGVWDPLWGGRARPLVPSGPWNSPGQASVFELRPTEYGRLVQGHTPAITQGEEQRC